ncbi:hypothetical protein VR7878_03251 [Vibrio ruber DSM 16370]|uniref:Uncharacterized protein n=1 Tax=Vibrio ruber (strain DSM 16370 / JCM 11486 / BCRC 17186 / CECT 7878 / LMG 23124 / VR1) TaxID=1123498 RepID=A0A1R4LRC3_VIBR1|nr:hypothetical protein [Vibrio ruber]SJN59142.1 hypothetical protein VR7878_03251 [Vibrio ruber DSM 16370]
MRKKHVKSPKKHKKSNYEAKFELMVKEYHSAQEVLDGMSEDSADYAQQKKHCESLFASAERFFKQNQ